MATWNWGKIRKHLKNNLPDSLKGKIDFAMTCYPKTRTQIIEIKFEKQIILRAYSDLAYLRWSLKRGIKTHRDYLADKFFDVDEFIDEYKKYFQLKHEESAKIKDNIYFRMFALLDRRTGKRTLKRFIDDGDFVQCAVDKNYELEALYKIRFKADNIKYSEDEIEILKIILGEN